jgi:hypothetical protein
MKNRTQNGIMILCFLLSVTLFSCQKQDTGAPATGNENLIDYPVQEPYVETQDNPPAGNTLDMTATSFGTRQNLYFNFTTESASSLTSWYGGSTTLWKYVAGWTSNSITRSSAFARSGSYSGRYELNKTDGDVGGSKRAETNRSLYDEPVLKCERWYGISYFLPTEFVSDKAPEILMQWHTNGTYPPLALWTINGQWQIVQFGNIATNLGAYDKNKWTDFVYHIKWSSGSDGLIELWKNGVKVFTKSGATLKTTDINIYMKAGIYKWPWKTGSYGSTTTKRVVYIDDVRIGSNLATYADVAPGP